MSNKQQQQSNSSSSSVPANLATPQVSLAPQSSLHSNVLTPSAAAALIAKSKVDYVQVDALVVVKILKHCHELGGGAELVQGILTGMINYPDGGSGSNGPKRIEITNCFGLPNPNTFKAGSPDYNQVCNDLITDNLKHYRHLNIDHLIVGWYQSSLFGSFVNKTFIEDHFMYQSEIDDSVVLIFGSI